MSPDIVAAVEAAIEGRLTPDQARLLEATVRTDPAARAYYVECLGLHSDLTDLESPAPELPMIARAFLRPRRWAAWAAAGIAASVCLAVGGWLFGDRLPVAVAALAEAKSCRWEAGTLPTDVGSALPPGRLRLADGLARIVFAGGADVQLEGPADLEIVSAGRCVLHAGRLVASVPPPAQGFVVETPTAVVTDWGTEFGVRVGDGRAADVQVFRGHVDVTHRPTGDTKEMRTGANFRFSPTEVLTFAEAGERSQLRHEPPRPGGREVRITTAQGRGRDAYVHPVFARSLEHVSDTLLLVKRAKDGLRVWDRRAYLGFDLAALGGAAVADAELALTFDRSGYGFSALVPDATFAVYGLADGAADDWPDAGLTWATAPANRGVGEPLDPAKAVRLGSFVVPQGVQWGTFTVSGPDLAEFLNRDTNRLVTLIVVRETAGLDRDDLVHGIASRRHPRLSPPTLRLTVADRPK